MSTPWQPSATARPLTRPVNRNKTTKSCFNCPQSMDEAKQNEVLGANFGSTICPIKMLTIGRPDGDSKQPETQAKKCDSYGKPASTYKAEIKTVPIMLEIGWPKVITEDPTKPEEVNTCRSCEHYSPPAVTQKLIGWKSGYCLAKGALLLDDRTGRYAAGCESRSLAKQAKSPFRPESMRGVEITLLPEYQPGYGKPDPLAALMVNADFDPASYKSDRELSPAAIKAGLRAYRRIEDPKGIGPAVYLPIFDHEKMTERQRSGIPSKNDSSKPHMYVDHSGLVYRLTVLWTRLGETPALWGSAGVGKTELLRHMAWLMNLPFTRISITASTEIDDIAGKMMYSPERGTYFHYGRIPRAWQEPNVLCLDEANVGQPEVWQFLRPLTDDSKQLVLDQNEGERIDAHPGCYLGFAMNPSWDPRNIGAMPLGDADGSRLMHVSMGLPPSEIEAAILKRCLEMDKVDPAKIEEYVKLVMQIAPEIRDLSNDGTIPISWGIRNQIKVVRAMRYFSPVAAFRNGVTDALEPSAADPVLDVVRRFAPEEDAQDETFKF